MMNMWELVSANALYVLRIMYVLGTRFTLNYRQKGNGLERSSIQASQEITAVIGHGPLDG